MHDTNDAQALYAMQQHIQAATTHQFAPEDEGLRNALVLAKAAGLPAIQISPLQGKFLQVLAAACDAHKILEIGSLAGYSGIWLARALPPHGRLITLEANPQHAQLTRRAFRDAGVEDRTQVYVGLASELLPQLRPEAPFDLVFIDADKGGSPQYLAWALRLCRRGSIIVADNSIPGGTKLRYPEPGSDEAIAAYNLQLVSDPDLVAVALPMDERYTDGFAIAVVRHQVETPMIVKRG
jgi:caffeoyl-CoA O-methyltransferase